MLNGLCSLDSVLQRNIVNPERVADGADEGLVDGGGHDEDGVGGGLVGLGPALFLYLDDFPLAVLGVVVEAFGTETHIVFIAGVAPGVAIDEGHTEFLDPPRGGLHDACHGSAYPEGVDVAILVLPAFLEDKGDLVGVVARNGLVARDLAVGHGAFVGHGRLVVEHEGFGPLAERHPPVHEGVGIVGSGDGLEDIAPEDAAADENLDVDAEDLEVFKLGL